MAQRQKPQDCKYYPLCEYLTQLMSEFLSNAEEWDQVALPADAELICIQCHGFVPKPKEE